MKASTRASKLNLPFPTQILVGATEKANHYLATLPTIFRTGGAGFYSILNQRNLSGFVGEVLKHSIFALQSDFAPNPHPDGRPDLLDLRTSTARSHLSSKCFDSKTGGPLREFLAPFIYGGVEVKCTIGKILKASDYGIGVPRVEKVTGFTYWGHHAHACNLLGVYYDFSDQHSGCPQIRAMFYTPVDASDWYKVSTGNPNKKKTSNTSLNASGISKLYQSLVVYKDAQPYTRLFSRLGIPV